MKAAVYLALVASVNGAAITKTNANSYIAGKQKGNTKCDSTVASACKIGGTAASPKKFCCLTSTDLSATGTGDTGTITIGTGWCGDATWAGSGATTSTLAWFAAGGSLEAATGTLSCATDTTTVPSTDAQLKAFIALRPCPASGGECGFVTDTVGTIQCCMTGKGTPLGGTENTNKAGFCSAKTHTNFVDAFPTGVGIVGDLTYKKTTCSTPNATKADITTAIAKIKCPELGCWTKEKKYTECCMTATVTPAGALAKDALTKQKYCALKAQTAAPPTAGAWKGAKVVAACKASILTVCAAAGLAIAATI